jgi:hypothetical protein
MGLLKMATRVGKKSSYPNAAALIGLNGQKASKGAKLNGRDFRTPQGHHDHHHTMPSFSITILDQDEEGSLDNFDLTTMEDFKQFLDYVLR